jgi:uncharacterized protein
MLKEKWPIKQSADKSLLTLAIERMVILPESSNLPRILRQLVDSIRPYESCVVAFSGGVDSSVVAKAACEALHERAIAITGVGPSVTEEDIRCAKLVSEAIGIRHLLLDTAEIEDPDYLANSARRCFHCKTNLYKALGTWANSNGITTILSGTNVDDLGDYRPGLDAARDFCVVAPLVDVGIDKASVRLLAEHWKLPVAKRPASPCLASRVAYGEPITVAKLRLIEKAERWFTERGFHDVRVRLHPGMLARIEIPCEELSRVVEPSQLKVLNDDFRRFGFQFVTIDAGGRQSGSLNRLLPTIQ